MNGSSGVDFRESHFERALRAGTDKEFAAFKTTAQLHGIAVHRDQLDVDLDADPPKINSVEVNVYSQTEGKLLELHLGCKHFDKFAKLPLRDWIRAAQRQSLLVRQLNLLVVRPAIGRTLGHDRARTVGLIDDLGTCNGSGDLSLTGWRKAFADADFPGNTTDDDVSPGQTFDKVLRLLVDKASKGDWRVVVGKASRLLRRSD